MDKDNKEDPQIDPTATARQVILDHPPQATIKGSPALWLALLAVPLVFGLMIGLTKGDIAEVETPVQTYKCDFSPWVGQTLTGKMIEAVKGAGRPYRVIKPNEERTDDLIPARINFEINSAGAITRAWCG